MVDAGNWRGALGDLLDAVPHDVDRFVLELLTQRGADGALFKDVVPEDALAHMNGEYHNYWWANTGTVQADAWMSHHWRVLRADPHAHTITFARLL